MVDTLIARLREQHASCVVPCFIHAWVGDRPHCGECTYAWPCDTIAALDALGSEVNGLKERLGMLAALHRGGAGIRAENVTLQARLDAATEQAEALAAALEDLQAVVQATCEGGYVDMPGIEILGEALEEADAAPRAFRAWLEGGSDGSD